jgi:hypothetical protein
MPRPHRCNARVEDFVQVCIRSKPGAQDCPVVAAFLPACRVCKSMLGHLVAATTLRSPLMQAVVTWDYAGKIQPAWRLMRQCFKSEPGQEPREPYLVIKDPQAYLDPRRLYAPRPDMERS